MLELFDGQEKLCLLVDDEPTVLMVTGKMLKKLNFEVLEISDAREAQKIIESRLSDLNLLVLDYSMPVLGGEDLFIQLRSLSEEIPVVICSGYTDDFALERLSHHSSLYFLRKPYTIQDLSAKIEEVFQSSR